MIFAGSTLVADAPVGERAEPSIGCHVGDGEVATVGPVHVVDTGGVGGVCGGGGDEADSNSDSGADGSDDCFHVPYDAPLDGRGGVSCSDYPDCGWCRRLRLGRR